MDIQTEMIKVAKIIDILKKKKSKKKLIIADSQKCALCHFILNDPCQTLCGCVFCRDCIEVWMKENVLCPGEHDDCKGQRLTNKNDIVKDVARAREIFRVNITCIFDGCDSVVELARMGDHMTSCESRPDKCDLCGVDVLQNCLSIHHETECDRRKDVCANRPLLCVLSVCGCPVDNLTEEQLVEHLRNNLLSHSSLLVESLSEKDDKIRELEHKLKYLDQEIENLKRDIISVENAMGNWGDWAYKDEPTSFMLPEDGDAHNRNGVLLWRIEKFGDLRERALDGRDICITSEPFYSSDFGYKICIKMYPNGDGAGRGSHISVFIVIMKGDYDDILSWPFCHKIKLSLISSTDTSLEHSEILKPDHNPSCYNKPKNIFNVGSGSPKFFDRCKLVKDFIKGDQFFIKATVMVE